jgi:hypothetical protein
MDASFDGQDDELARMQELSNNWEPEAKVCLLICKIFIAIFSLFSC